MSEVTIQVTRFGYTNNIKKKVIKVVANIAFDGYHFLEVPAIEWPIKNSHDVILG